MRLASGILNQARRFRSKIHTEWANFDEILRIIGGVCQVEIVGRCYPLRGIVELPRGSSMVHCYLVIITMNIKTYLYNLIIISDAIVIFYKISISYVNKFSDFFKDDYCFE